MEFTIKVITSQTCLIKDNHTYMPHSGAINHVSFTILGTSPTYLINKTFLPSICFSTRSSFFSVERLD